MRRALLLLAGGAAAAVALQEAAARWYYRRTGPPVRFVEPREHTAWTPLWREAGLLGDVLALVRSGGELNVPRGDGAPVVLVQGFLTRGDYLGAMRRGLERAGYACSIAGIGWNTECPDVLTNRLVDIVRGAAVRHGRRVHLVGHSLGGVIARAAAARAPDAVASVAALGSPLRGLRIHPLLRAAAAIVRASVHRRRGTTVRPECLTFACGCDTVRAASVALPAELPQLSVLSEVDGFLDWRTCEADGVDVVRVDASHVGLAFHPAVLAAVGRHLARAGSAPTREVHEAGKPADPTRPR